MTKQKPLYNSRDVIPDIRRYVLGEIARNDVYGTSTLENSTTQIVGELISDVLFALKDPEYLADILERNGPPVPDRIRILLESVGLASEDEVLRRWEVLKNMYTKFAEDCIKMPEIIHVSAEYAEQVKDSAY